MVNAWYMNSNDETEDQRSERHLSPPQFLSLEELKAKTGVLYWQLDADNHETDERLAKLRADRGYSYQDQLELSASTLPDYQAKLKIFFTEHIHADEEIRFILEGSGYFDVRDADDRWVRILVEKNDLLVLPAGIYHRFTPDKKDYVKVIRLFIGEPVWTPINRPAEEHPARQHELPLSYRLRTVPLVCRRWTGLQPLVRRAVTSVTLLSGDISEVDHSERLISPFRLVNKRTIVTEAPDFLQLSTSADTAADVVDRLQTELPNIRRLSIVQVNQPSSAFQPELLSAVEAFAGQLTSFALYFQIKGSFYESELDMAVISASFHRFLSLINYKMPQLRHLLLNTDQSFFFNDNVGNYSIWAYKMRTPGSLYLPVLRRLHTFSFKSPYHADILYYSLLKFVSENNHLKVRLVHLPFFTCSEESPLKKLWKNEVVISHVDYLLAISCSLSDMQKLCHLANIKYLDLYDYFIDHDSKSLLSLFTILSSSFPKLTTFSLHLMNPMKLVLEDLPPLPLVTNLTLNWQLDDGCGFGAIFQPSRVFPALRHLTIVPNRCAEPYSYRAHEYDLSTIQQALKPLKFYLRGALQHISINFCKEFCQDTVLTGELWRSRERKLWPKEVLHPFGVVAVALAADALHLLDLAGLAGRFNVLEVHVRVLAVVDDRAKKVEEALVALEGLKELNQRVGGQLLVVLPRHLHADLQVLANVVGEHRLEALQRVLRRERAKVVDQPLLVEERAENALRGAGGHLRRLNVLARVEEAVELEDEEVVGAGEVVLRGNAHR
ncbi:1,2-dihydroxy-3-keto-5-methylthiopentene dioxygenase [Tyrophagus putrescentiae]|nr:1,2-dihydroxy-3-keto-5-methylthiopentene dioxygenase [Tyrophagus putrescentiae]